MSLLARLFDFAPNTPINSGDVDSEFNQLVNGLNGVSTGTNFLMRYNNAADPPLRVDQLGAGVIQQWAQVGIVRASITNDGSFSTSGGATFGAIPTLPASNPTTDNQAVRKAYVDGKKTVVSLNWFEADPSVVTVSSEDRGQAIIPAATGLVFLKVNAFYVSGSHTSGGSVTYTFRVRDGNGTTDIGSVSLNNTNNSSLQIYSTTISYTFNPPGVITYYVSARSGTITERLVSIGVSGTQLVG